MQTSARALSTLSHEWKCYRAGPIYIRVCGRARARARPSRARALSRAHIGRRDRAYKPNRRHITHHARIAIGIDSNETDRITQRHHGHALTAEIWHRSRIHLRA